MTLPVVASRTAKSIAGTDLPLDWTIALKLPPIASSLAAPLTFVIARTSPLVWAKAIGVLLINVVGFTLPKLGVTTSAWKVLAAAGDASAQSAVAGMSFSAA